MRTGFQSMRASLIYTYIVVAAIGVTSAQSWDFNWTRRMQRDGVSMLLKWAPPECVKASISCTFPVLLGYMDGVSSPTALLERMRSIPLDGHCRNFGKVFPCFDQLVGRGKCAEMDPAFVSLWSNVKAIYNNAWNQVCKERFKDFERHFRCIHSKEVVARTNEECAGTRHVYKKNTESSKFSRCSVGIIEKVCGSEAAVMIGELIMSTGNLLEDIPESQVQEFLNFANQNAKYDDEIIDHIIGDLQSEFVNLLFSKDSFENHIAQTLLKMYNSDSFKSLPSQNPKDADEAFYLLNNKTVEIFFDQGLALFKESLIREYPQYKDKINEMFSKYESEPDSLTADDEL